MNRSEISDYLSSDFSAQIVVKGSEISDYYAQIETSEVKNTEISN